MKTSLFGIIAAGTMLMAQSALAIVLSQTNSTLTVVDESSATNTVAFNAGDFTTGTAINKVTIAVDFSKCGTAVDSTGCTGASGIPFADEIAFVLTSPTGTNVVLVENAGGDESLDTSAIPTFNQGIDDLSRIVITFDDAGGALPLVPTDGTFAPEGNLADFIGEPGDGVWSLFFEDDFFGDPLGVHSFTVTLDVGGPEEPPVAVAEPGMVGLLGLAMVGMVAMRRRRR